MQTLPRTTPGVVFIYALKDPQGRIRYIGKTINPALRRASHIRLSERKDHKAHWMNKLVKAGTPPTMVILERVPVAKWRAAETRWIRRMRAHGFDLVNSTDGGEGLHGRVRPPEERQRISATLQGRPRPAATRAKISATLEGHAVAPETREALSRAQTGRVYDAATREKVSAALRARWAAMTPEEKATHISDKRRPTWTPEMRAALSAKKLQTAPRADGSLPGVRLNPKTGKWQAQVRADGRNTHLGSFLTQAEAAEARRARLAL